MLQQHQATKVVLPLDPAPKRRPMIRVVLHADDLLHSSGVIESIIDTLFDRMTQTSVVVCVRHASSKHTYE